MIKISSRPMLIFCLLIIFSLEIFAQTDKLFLGLKLRPEVRVIADEIEQKTKQKISAEFVEFDDPFMLGASYIDETGVAILHVSSSLKPQKQRLEAVIAHELLHLRLRVNDYPVFLFSPDVKTRRGSAQDVEQSNANDLASLIEHRIFKAEMDKLGLNQILDLAGDTERTAESRRGEEDSQADAINFARAVLEYQNKTDVEKLRAIYQTNKWQKSLKIGQEIADLISRSTINSPEMSAKVFLLCLAKLYPSPRPFKLIPDKTVKSYRQLLIGF